MGEKRSVIIAIVASAMLAAFATYAVHRAADPAPLAQPRALLSGDPCPCPCPCGDAGIDAPPDAPDAGIDAPPDALDAGIDAPPDAPDAAIDAPPDAPPDDAPPDPTVPWYLETLVPWSDCNGADGVDVKRAPATGKLRIAVACEQGAEVIVADEADTPPWPFVSLPSGGAPGVQGPEDAVQCDGDGDGRLDIFGAMIGRVMMWRDTGLGYYDLPEFVAITAGPALQRFIRIHCVSPGVIIAMSYSINAQIDKFTRTGYGAWSKQVLRAPTTPLAWPKNIVPYGEDFLVWDHEGPKRGVSTLFGGVRLTQDINTEWGDLVDGRVTTGTANVSTMVSTISILGEPPIPWPANTGLYHYAKLVDVDHLGGKDLVITMSHSTPLTSSIVWLRSPTWERGEISGPDGEKHDNWWMEGEWIYYTEEKTGGLQRRRNPFGAPPGYTGP